MRPRTSSSTQLGRVAGVERAELVAPADAAKRLERALGADAALLDGVDLASLPATVEVTLSPGVRDVISMSPLLGALRANPGVEDVIVEDGGDTAKSTDTLATLRAFVYAGAALLAGLAIVVVLAAIAAVRPSPSRRDRQERAVLHLLGAGPMFSIVPGRTRGNRTRARRVARRFAASCDRHSITSSPWPRPSLRSVRSRCSSSPEPASASSAAASQV